MAQTVKNLPEEPKTWVRSLGQEDLLEKGMEADSSILARRILWTEKPVGLQSIGSDRKSTRLNSSHSGQSRMPSSA